MTDRIYLDYAATTPVAAEVLEAMLPYFGDRFGNASSRSHAFGWTAAQAVERATGQLANLLRVASEEITYTSGSTEAINLALKGIAYRYRSHGSHIVTSSAEHSAVLDTCQQLEREGFRVSYLQPGSDGRVSADEVADAITDETTLCSVMWANNETGVISDVAAIGRACRDRGVLYFCDATQAVGKVPVQPREAYIDVLAASAHKFYGPKGIGALWVRGGSPRVAIAAQVHGGGHQGGLRSGTLNVPGIVGMGEAAALASREMSLEAARLRQLRDKLETRLQTALAPVLVNGGSAPRLPHISNLSIRFVEAEALLSRLQRRLALATGSACASADMEPSHVLRSMGLSDEDAKSAVRISVGRRTTEHDVDVAIELLTDAARSLRAESPVYELFLDGLV